MDKVSVHEYLGDGVYAEYDGYAISIRVGDHRNEVAVVMEPEVIVALNRFIETLKRRFADGKEQTDNNVSR